MIDSVKQKAVVLILSMAVMAGCSSTATQPGQGSSEVAPTDQNGGAQVYSGNGAGGVSSSTSTEGQSAQQQQTKQQQEAALRQVRTFYFDFDTAEIKPEARDALMAHAAYLAANPSAKVQLQGYTDERGSKEYNLALGERRGNAVKQFLVLNGASADQISVISYGEENPADPGHNDAAWAKNRRVVLIYK